MIFSIQICPDDHIAPLDLSTALLPMPLLLWGHNYKCVDYARCPHFQLSILTGSTVAHWLSILVVVNRVCSLLPIASSCGHSEVVKLLIASGADTSLKDIDNNDPVSVANDDITRLAFNQNNDQ